MDYPASWKYHQNFKTKVLHFYQVHVAPVPYLKIFFIEASNFFQSHYFCPIKIFVCHYWQCYPQKSNKEEIDTLFYILRKLNLPADRQKIFKCLINYIELHCILSTQFLSFLLLF